MLPLPIRDAFADDPSASPLLILSDKERLGVLAHGGSGGVIQWLMLPLALALDGDLGNSPYLGLTKI
jgi:hypothetical protein